MARVLLTGAAGMLGRAVSARCAGRHEIVPSTRNGRDETVALDVTDEASVEEALAAIRPDWVLNAAAYTAVDLAEDEPDLAHAANAVAPEILALAARRHGARLLHVSTDFVFDGEKGSPYVEGDPTGPRGVYATTKEEGERRVRRALPDDHVIVRVAWLFGDGKNFVATMVGLAGAGKSLRVVADQEGTPTFTEDAADVMATLMERDARGTLHCSNTGVTTWHELARTAIRAAGHDVDVAPITTAEWPTKAPRPRNSALLNAALRSLLGEEPMRPWQDAVGDYLSR